MKVEFQMKNIQKEEKIQSIVLQLKPKFPLENLSQNPLCISDRRTHSVGGKRQGVHQPALRGSDNLP